MRSVLAFIVLLLASSGTVEAHSGGTTGFAKVTVKEQTIRLSLTLGLDAVEKAKTIGNDYDVLAGLVTRHTSIEADGKACAPLPGIVEPPTPDKAAVVIIIHYACAASVRTLLLRDNLFDVLGSDHHTLAIVDWPGGQERFLLEPERREARLVIPGAAPPPAASPFDEGVLGFFLLGIRHILEGFDHILFIFALILGGGRLRSLLIIVTAFTVAHSVTLALATLGIVRPPSWIIEPLIALSIAYVAFENIFMASAASRRWLVSLVFGLVHGFGFAGALVELGLPQSTLFSSLLLFNLGVEAGQALIVGLLFPALLWLSRFSWSRRAVTSVSAVVLVAALALLAERALAG